jgi:hypothetical protein
VYFANSLRFLSARSVGIYGTSSRIENQGHAQEALSNSLATIKDHVYKTAALQETGFYAKLNVFNDGVSTAYKHGQYSYCSRCGTLGDSPPEDNHHSPLKPHDYLEFRVKPLVHFYQKRLPRYYSTRTSSTATILLSTIGSTLLILLGQAPWTAILAALSTVVTAWAAFNSTDKKLSRLSATINSIDGVLLSWRTFSDVEQASVINTDNLIWACEEIFRNERQVSRALFSAACPSTTVTDHTHSLFSF